MLDTKYQILNTKFKSGFSLIELLVVVGVFGGMMVALTGLFMSVLSGASKADATARIRENGDMVLLLIERRVREGNEVFCEYGDTLTVRYPTSLSRGQEIFMHANYPVDHIHHQFLGTDDLILSGQNLLSSGVVAESFVVNCDEGVPGFTPDRVSIEFRLTTGDQVGRASERYAETFRTGITLRNLRELE